MRVHRVGAVALVSMNLAGLPSQALGATVKVGSFTKSTGAAPVTQAVAHGLGETPKALILWTNGKTSETFSGSYLYALGASDGTTSKSAATASDDNLATSNASRRIANKALTVVQWGESLQAEADLQSWDATNFTLNWTTNNATAYVVHFVAIGGGEVSAKVLGWTMKSGTTGNQSVTGVGFMPTVVFHAHVGAGFTSTPPASAASGSFGFGVMDANGHQWATASFTSDNAGTSDTQRYQRTDKCIVAINSSLGVSKEASWVSMDSDGFTINWPTVDGAASTIFSLALKGITAIAGSFAKSTASAPASQSVTGMSFRPSVLMLMSFQDVTQANPVAHTRLGIGASDGTASGSSTFQDTDALTTTSVDAIDKTSKVFVKVDNSTPAIDAEADLQSLDGGGFTLNWTTNDAVATEILYLAMITRRRVMIVGEANPARRRPAGGHDG